jgi:hypothetical protein
LGSDGSLMTRIRDWARLRVASLSGGAESKAEAVPKQQVYKSQIAG